MTCSFFVVENLIFSFHGRDRRRDRVFEWTADLCTLMDSTGRVKLHVGNSFSRRTVSREYRWSCAICTARYPPITSHCTKHPSRTHNHAGTLHASSADSTAVYCTANKYRFTNFTVFFRSKGCDCPWIQLARNE